MTTKPTYTPAIRFPDFLNDGEWEVKRLGEIAESFTGLTYSPEQVVENGGTLVLRSSNIKNGVLSFEDNVYVQMDIPERAITHIGDLLICVRNGSKNLIGKSAVITKEAENTAFGAFMTVLRAKEGTDQEFLNFLWQSDMIQNQILRNFGSTINQITSKDLNGYKVIVPPLAEQRRIAACLSALDEMLAATNGKLEQLKAYKKGLMQKLFPAKGKKLPKLRFKEFEKDGEWEEKKLATIVHQITTGKLDANAMVSNGEYRFYTCAKDYAFINEYAFDTEALLISGNGAHLGYIHYYKGKFNAYQRTYVLSDFQCDIFYLKYYLESFLPDRINKEKKEGNTPYIVLSTLTEMDISLPSNFEQHKIADCLTSIDEMINQYTNKVTFLGQYKKGLMQRMFPQ